MELDPQRRQWLDEIYREHADRVFRTCARFSAGDRAWALDRMQDVFVRMAERIDDIRNTDDPGGWLYRVAVNVCFANLRRDKTWTRLLDSLPLGTATRTPSPEGEVEARRALTALEGALRELPGKQRSVVVLVHVENKSQNEAAALLGLSKGQVSKLHARARATLRERGWTVDDA